MSTSWQWFPDTKEAICNYCGFRTAYADDFPGHLEHDCHPAKHPALTARQGLPIGRSPRPESATRIPLDQLLVCIPAAPSSGRSPTGTRINIFACAVHGERQLDDTLAGVKHCGHCADLKRCNVLS